MIGESSRSTPESRSDHAAYMRQYRSDPAHAALTKARNRAADKAKTRLARKRRAEYRVFYLEELAVNLKELDVPSQAVDQLR